MTTNITEQEQEVLKLAEECPIDDPYLQMTGQSRRTAVQEFASKLRAKDASEIESLKKQVAMLANMFQSVWSVIPKEVYFSKETIDSANAKLSNTKATAEAWEREHDAKVLEDFYRDYFIYFWNRICELSDRNSPEDEPDSIVANMQELKSCFVSTLEQCAEESYLRAQPVESDLDQAQRFR
jgi:hypothetical protein